jgi:hypothetical protein
MPISTWLEHNFSGGKHCLENEIQCHLTYLILLLYIANVRYKIQENMLLYINIKFRIKNVNFLSALSLQESSYLSFLTLL